MAKTLLNSTLLFAASLLLAAVPALGRPQAPAEGARPATPPPPAAATPRSPKAPAPGYADGRGPTGPVTLRILSPKQDDEIPLPGAVANGASVRVVLDLKNYETFFDPATKTGQAVALFLDGLPYFTHYNAALPWSFKKVAPGTHTLRAVPIRPWGEPIREPGAFASVTFSVGPRAEKNAPAPGEPILTILSPRFRSKIPAAQAQAIPFSFLVSGCTLAETKGPDTCRVRYRVDGAKEVILTDGKPVSIGPFAPGLHTLAAGLTRDEKLIPGAFTLVQGYFEVEADGGAATTPAK